MLSGTARCHSVVGETTVDGAWAAEPDGAAPFTTRLIVHRPSVPGRFNGTVIVEWLNVSSGTDIAPGWLYSHRQIVRSGAAYVGVSAQRAGIEGGGLVTGAHLKVLAPARYAGLEHPGDAFAYDIFSCAGHVVRNGHPLVNRRPDRLIAIGDSQSAVFLVTYINAVDLHEGIYDGFLLQVRGGNGAPLDGQLICPAELANLDLQATVRRMSAGHRVRSDCRVPVMIVQSETDQFTLSGLGARQSDSGKIRTWEIAGASHVDSYLLVAAHLDDGTLTPPVLAKTMTATTAPAGVPVAVAVNSGPQQHYVMQAALASLEGWTASGPAPPRAQPLQAGGDGRLLRDRDGIAVGGVRTPWVDVPVSIFSGEGQVGGTVFALLFGTTTPLPLVEVLTRYRGGAADYRRRFAAATRTAVSAGFLLAEDEDEINGIGAAQWPTWPM